MEYVSAQTLIRQYHLPPRLAEQAVREGLSKNQMPWAIASGLLLVGVIAAAFFDDTNTHAFRYFGQPMLVLACTLTVVARLRATPAIRSAAQKQADRLAGANTLQ